MTKPKPRFTREQIIERKHADAQLALEELRGGREGAFCQGIPQRASESGIPWQESITIDTSKLSR